MLGVETNITGWQRRQNQQQQFLRCRFPMTWSLQRKECKEFLDDLTTRDQRMMFAAVLTMVITADTKDQLDLDTEAVLSTARKRMCQMADAEVSADGRIEHRAAHRHAGSSTPSELSPRRALRC